MEEAWRGPRPKAEGPSKRGELKARLVGTSQLDSGQWAVGSGQGPVSPVPAHQID